MSNFTKQQSFMVQLTKAEEQIMQVLWGLGQATVQDIRDKLDEPKPARTTVATILSILENKGFASRSNSGRTNVYLPAIAKDDYSKTQLSGLLKNYFNNSFAAMASFFVRENNYSVEELDQLLEDTRKDLDHDKKQ